jgi:hypothetical protein
VVDAALARQPARWAAVLDQRAVVRFVGHVTRALEDALE